MQRQIYVNIPVKDIEKTNAFFRALGFEFNADYSNEKATCMII
jgi:predicted lactoylglutathione lyase